MPVNIDIQEKLQRLQEQYALTLPTKVEGLRSLWQNVCNTPDDPELLETLIRDFHTLAGSGTSFGFPEVTRAARNAEHILKADQKSNQAISENSLSDIPVCLDDLEDIALNGPDNAISTAGLKQPKIEPADVPQNKRLIFFLNAIEPQNEDIQQQLTHYGYLLAELQTIEQIEAGLESQIPGAIIIETEDLSKTNIKTIQKLKNKTSHDIPLIIVSNQNDTKHRLQAVRAGASAFFTTPLDYPLFVDTLDNLTSTHEPEPFRILIMDDSPASADFYSFTLQSAGMQTQVVTQPLTIMQHIQEFRPELILMDIFMPECKGTELATLIRQDESYVGTPIVFLSSETDANAQQQAMRHGGDDFLTKPIKSEHLISAVSTRAERYRKLRSFMVRDSLTGLYNHTSTKELLGRELSRAIRTNTPLSFCMLDIDHFKNVNDSYGHATGDRVIKILSRLLKQRLRRTDIIGRYGGEEFAVIMPETDAQHAASVIDEIRKSFKNIKLTQGEKQVKVSFSAGVAAFPTYSDPIILNDAADQALYRAKDGGRNRVELAKLKAAS